MDRTNWDRGRVITCYHYILLVFLTYIKKFDHSDVLHSITCFLAHLADGYVNFLYGEMMAELLFWSTVDGIYRETFSY